MIENKRVAVVMPAYNAAATLEKTYSELPHDIVDDVIVVDDFSSDHTVEVARKLGIDTVIRHEVNRGYGGNQKTCYRVAIEQGADIVVMVHPDYQYSPHLCGAMAWMIASGEYDMVLASRILGSRNGALAGGMPVYKYISNRFLTLIQNILLGTKLSEFHTGYRAFSRNLLISLPLEDNSDDFIFDNQMIVQAHQLGFEIGEISCPTRYDDESSSINFARSMKYGLGVLWVSLQYRLGMMNTKKAEDTLLPQDSHF